ncbi:MAG: hypothetical protein M0006_02480 [Magnetospirillum sp.]|nr:hypothetical protein [Magnetospirillum sp.]
MDRGKRARTRWMLIAAGLLWMAGSGWIAFSVMPDDAVLTMNSPTVKDEMRDRCFGSFGERYDCKEAIVLKAGRTTFANVLLGLGLMLAGPVAAILAFRRFCPPDPEPRRQFQAYGSSPADSPPLADDMAWKRAAQEHTVFPTTPPGDGDHSPSGQE